MKIDDAAQQVLTDLEISLAAAPPPTQVDGATQQMGTVAHADIAGAVHLGRSASLTAEREGGWTTSLQPDADGPVDVILGLQARVSELMAERDTLLAACDDKRSRVTELVAERNQLLTDRDRIGKSCFPEQMARDALARKEEAALEAERPRMDSHQTGWALHPRSVLLLERTGSSV